MVATPSPGGAPAERHIIVFRSRLRPGVEAPYAALAAHMATLARAMPGFVSSADFTAEDGERVAIMEFAGADALSAWRHHPEHRAAQERGRREFYTSYTLQVCTLVRESLFNG